MERRLRTHGAGQGELCATDETVITGAIIIQQWDGKMCAACVSDWVAPMPPTWCAAI